MTKRGAELILAEMETLRRKLEVLAEGEADEARHDLRYWEARAGRTQTLHIVGEDEANPKQGYLAYTAPLAKALEEAKAGETVEFEATGRVDPIQILSVRPI